ncbi:biotin--[acetyl-CoA-carboxylase] ligase [Sandaracinus amylolyticus]|uniref:biotin--[acetyl-CoA-carboxylase] ligase n=1 Tax=Sandaracinus amylolyticus TaxID=927083 RepID=UPI001F01A766|nr:biotin--[acetyl-CoA-carboxylase] ligase [Sandaracinus amylolyticus]UJR81196.1 Biotin--acetyl-CoA-carboxylase ligase [Sandaracinus amylolyticus]
MQDLDPERIRSLLTTRAYGRSLDVRESTASTNDDAREAARAGAARGHVVVADAQSRGRGAHGRVWSSPSGTDLYLSIVERVTLSPERVAPLTLAVGLGVADAVRALAPALEPRVKWPNDVWIGRRKTAGVLVEASSIGARMDAIVIGVGLGVNRLAWHEELASSATSVLHASRELDAVCAELDRASALATLLGAIEAWVDRFVAEGPAPVVRALEERLALRGERVRCDDVEGVLVGVESSGALRLETSSGPRSMISGTLRPL